MLPVVSPSHVFFFLLSVSTTLSTLQFVQIWFRHGERTPTNFGRFPSDPPDYGIHLTTRLGELTPRGIQQEYALGERLLKEYGDLIGGYDSKRVRVLAGEDNRTIASGQAVLVSLFPPKEAPIPGLNWQPVPIHTKAILDELSFGVVTRCKYMMDSVGPSRDYQSILSSVDPNLLRYLRDKTGLAITDPYTYQNVLDSLRTKRNLNDTNLPYPDWGKPLLEQLDSLSNNAHVRMTKILNNSIGGFHADTFLSSFEDHLILGERKALLIAGHDTNLMAIGAFFNIPLINETLCRYGGSLVAELHEEDELHVVKLFYSEGYNAPKQELKIPFCGSPCTLVRLQSLAEGKRWNEQRWRETCDGTAGNGSGVITASLLIALGLLVLTSVILLYTSCSYKKQLRSLHDPERRPLVG